MQLEITGELLNCTYPEECYLDENEKYLFGVKLSCKPVVYIFDPDSFLILRKDSDEAGYVERPVVFPSVSDIEVMKKYVEQLNSQKIERCFTGLSDDEYDRMFWNFFDDGGKKLTDVHRFVSYYRFKMIIDWCEENCIPYYVKDESVRNALDYYVRKK